MDKPFSDDILSKICEIHKKFINKAENCGFNDFDTSLQSNKVTAKYLFTLKSENRSGNLNVF